jgi:hypothetical protein
MTAEGAEFSQTPENKSPIAVLEENRYFSGL